ncbi:hypothetical protein AVEN_229366-1 [Araneus ventricosus]|uniref:Uncharacterized protein n=1 Tax=Araneus ventricosus TaxID=182803 RepID=A0A4Y2I2A7_ARAVE|nr:hypothetical protein AVEN_229366-1 [Araneus ventricosus]
MSESAEVTEPESEDTDSEHEKLLGDEKNKEGSDKHEDSQKARESEDETQEKSGEKSLSENLSENLSDLESDEMMDGLIQRALIAEREIQALLSLPKLSKEKQEEIRSSLQDLFKVCYEQVLITHLMDRVGSVETKKDKLTYAQIVEKPRDRDRSLSKTRKQHNVLIYPSQEQSSDQTKKEVQYKITPSELAFKVNGVKSVKKGGIIVNTPTGEDIDKLIHEFSKLDELTNKYEIMKPRLKTPSIIIFNIEENITEEGLLNGFKDQNEELANADLKTRTSFKSRFGRNWIVSLNASAFREVMKRKKLISVGIA